MAGIDIRKIFLNFIIYEYRGKYFGVDITHAISYNPEIVIWESKRGSNWECWSRAMIFIVLYLISSTQKTIWGRSLLFKERYDQKNPFQCQCLRLNVPFPNNYNPSLPWVIE